MRISSAHVIDLSLSKSRKNGFRSEIAGASCAGGHAVDALHRHDLHCIDDLNAQEHRFYAISLMVVAGRMGSARDDRIFQPCS
jgi:hypothetical protein